MTMIDDLCTLRADVTSFEVTQDIEAGNVNSGEIVEFACVPCRMSPTATSKGSGFGQQYMEATTLFHFPGAYYLTRQNKIYLRVYYSENRNIYWPTGARDRVFEVLGSRVPDEAGEFTIVAAREYDPGEL